LCVAKRIKINIPKDYGICTLSVVPIRLRPEDGSEMVTQLLFGETFQILQRKNASWIKILTHYDAYEGWIDPKQVELLTEEEFLSFHYDVAVSCEAVQMISVKDQTIPILIGSSLPNFDGMRFRTPMGHAHFNGVMQMGNSRQYAATHLEKLCRKFLRAPYLWGGRSLFGVDCSGFTQVVFKCLGIKLPRDAYQQVFSGQIVDFVEESLPGDLAFFHNDVDKIVHVGVILRNQEIIHASGMVRIDLIDHEGIFNREKKRYTHKLKIIKRVGQFFYSEEEKN